LPPPSPSYPPFPPESGFSCALNSVQGLDAPATASLVPRSSFPPAVLFPFVASDLADPGNGNNTLFYACNCTGGWSGADCSLPPFTCGAQSLEGLGGMPTLQTAPPPPAASVPPARGRRRLSACGTGCLSAKIDASASASVITYIETTFSAPYANYAGSNNAPPMAYGICYALGCNCACARGGRDQS